MSGGYKFSAKDKKFISILKERLSAGEDYISVIIKQFPKDKKYNKFIAGIKELQSKLDNLMDKSNANIHDVAQINSKLKSIMNQIPSDTMSVKSVDDQKTIPLLQEQNSAAQKYITALNKTVKIKGVEDDLHVDTQKYKAISDGLKSQNETLAKMQDSQIETLSTAVENSFKINIKKLGPKDLSKLQQQTSKTVSHATKPIIYSEQSLPGDVPMEDPKKIRKMVVKVEWEEADRLMSELENKVKAEKTKSINTMKQMLASKKKFKQNRTNKKYQEAENELQQLSNDTLSRSLTLHQINQFAIEMENIRKNSKMLNNEQRAKLKKRIDKVTSFHKRHVLLVKNYKNDLSTGYNNSIQNNMESDKKTLQNEANRIQKQYDDLKLEENKINLKNANKLEPFYRKIQTELKKAEQDEIDIDTEYKGSTFLPPYDIEIGNLLTNVKQKVQALKNYEHAIDIILQAQLQKRKQGTAAVQALQAQAQPKRKKKPKPPKPSLLTRAKNTLFGNQPTTQVQALPTAVQQPQNQPAQQPRTWANIVGTKPAQQPAQPPAQPPAQQPINSPVVPPGFEQKVEIKTQPITNPVGNWADLDESWPEANLDDIQLPQTDEKKKTPEEEQEALKAELKAILNSKVYRKSKKIARKKKNDNIRAKVNAFNAAHPSLKIGISSNNSGLTISGGNNHYQGGNDEGNPIDATTALCLTPLCFNLTTLVLVLSVCLVIYLLYTVFLTGPKTGKKLISYNLTPDCSSNDNTYLPAYLTDYDNAYQPSVEYGDVAIYQAQSYYNAQPNSYYNTQLL